MNDQDVLTTLLGSALPPVIALINQSHWKAPLKGVVALIACVAAATVAAWLRGQLDWLDWRRTMLLVAGAALVTYKVFWQPSQIAPAIETATSTRPAAYR